MVLRKSFYIHWSTGRSPRVHEVNPGRDPSLKTSFSTTIVIPPFHLYRHRQNKKHMMKRLLGFPVLVFPKNRGIDFVDSRRRLKLRDSLVVSRRRGPAKLLL